tara:strand:- start:12 stop:200 length:189 start_codon:yes stop_codon:yes gene_type:complete
MLSWIATWMTTNVIACNIAATPNNITIAAEEHAGEDTVLNRVGRNRKQQSNKVHFHTSNKEV